MTQLIDQFGRPHNNLRISVTDRCNLRCVYCMPEEVTFFDRHELLSFEEITQFTRIAVSLGINKVRLTGGEPLMRKNLPELIRQLFGIEGLTDIALTTNALLLKDQARPLYEAGLRRLNVSLDTLDPERFFQLARRTGLDETLEGLAEARACGFTPIKVNAVALRGYIEHDLVPLACYCREMGFELRLIEYMPIGAESWNRENVFSASEILEVIDKSVCPVVPASERDPHAPALDFDYTDGRGKLGIIASVTRPFCHQCNRLRLTAEGKLRNCLFALDEIDVKPMLRQHEIDEAGIRQALLQSVSEKWAGHQFNSTEYLKPLRTMHRIGG